MMPGGGGAAMRSSPSVAPTQRAHLIAIGHGTTARRPSSPVRPQATPARRASVLPSPLFTTEQVLCRGMEALVVRRDLHG